jgi:polysaccharide export outer membrane protein
MARASGSGLRQARRARRCVLALVLAQALAPAGAQPPPSGPSAERAPGVERAGDEAPPAAVRSDVPGVDASTYRVGPEDVLEVVVWKEEGLKKDALVRPDGGISFPLIGEVQAAGKTVLEIREEVGRKLAKFIPEASVSVAILKVGSQRVYVIGRVNRPGDFPVGRSVDVLQALSMAGGLTPFADANAIRIMRREGDLQVVLPFEYNRVVRGQKLEQNIQLRPGDVLVVP